MWKRIRDNMCGVMIIPKNLRAQVTFLSKPLFIIALIVMLLSVYMTVVKTTEERNKIKRQIKLYQEATHIASLLVNRKDCLAFYDSSLPAMRGYTISNEKLDTFSKIYNDTEPECARSFDFGWRAEIFREESGTWLLYRSFGALNFSPPIYRYGEVRIELPISIEYEYGYAKIGKLVLTLVDGELERLAGFLDKACIDGKGGDVSKKSKYFEINCYITYNKTSNLLCCDKACRRLYCKLKDFREIREPGEYVITVWYVGNNTLSVET